MTGSRGIGAFLVERCLPVYPILLTLWVCAVESITVVAGGAAAAWRPSWDTALKILALMAAGAFLRMVDDQRDLDYDTNHHPTRSLVQGRVTAQQLQRAMPWAAAVALVPAAAVSAWSVVPLAGALAYSLTLWWAEGRVKVLRDNAIANLAAVCPIQFLITGFAMTAAPGVGDASWWRIAAVPLVFTSALLHAEIARKTTVSLPGAAPDRHSYSELIGATASAALTCGFGLLAVVTEILVTAPWAWTDGPWPMAWLPAVAAVLPLVSAWMFLRGGRRDHPQAMPTLFVIVFYLAIIGQGFGRLP